MAARRNTADSGDWFSAQGVEGYTPYEQGGVAGTVGAPPLQAPAQAPAPAAAATPELQRQVGQMQSRFDLTNASVHGRPADVHDPNDLMYLASQQPGFDISSTEAAQKTFQNIIQPLYAQQGLQAQLGGKNADRIVAGGHTIDFIGNSSSSDPSQRRLQAYEAGNGQNGPGGPMPISTVAPAPGGDGGVPFGGGYGGGGVGGSSGGYTSSTPNVLTGSGQFDPYTYQAFTAPGEAGMLEDPGYKFRAAAGNQALTNSAAAKGLLHTGGTLKAFQDYNQGVASQEYGNVYNRRLGENQALNAGNLAGFQANTNVALGQGNLNLGYQNSNNQYALGQGQLQLGNKTADQNYALGQGQLGLGYQNSNNSYQLGLGQQQLGWANYGLGADQQQFFQNYQFPVSTGLQAAQYGSQYAGQYGQNAANNATGAGNAAASGVVGASNAWNQGVGGAYNAALGAYGAYQAGRKPATVNPYGPALLAL